MLVEKYGSDKIKMIRNINQIKEITDKHTHVIFDDVYFDLMPATTLINICDPDFEGVVRVLHTYVKVDHTITKWFTANDSSAFDSLLATTCQNEAIHRRLKVHQVSSRKDVVQILHHLIHQGP